MAVFLAIILSTLLIQVITKPAIRRLARRDCVKRIFPKNVIRDAVTYARQAEEGLNSSFIALATFEICCFRSSYSHPRYVWTWQGEGQGQVPLQQSRPPVHRGQDHQVRILWLGWELTELVAGRQQSYAKRVGGGAPVMAAVRSFEFVGNAARDNKT